MASTWAARTKLAQRWNERAATVSENSRALPSNPKATTVWRNDTDKDKDKDDAKPNSEDQPRIRRELWPRRWPSRSAKSSSEVERQEIPRPSPVLTLRMSSDHNSLGATLSTDPARPAPLTNGSAASLIKHAAAIIESEKLREQDVSFFITDVGTVALLFDHMTKAMPRVTPHYAVKCFPDKAVMQFLASHGAGFDCASAFEAHQVMDIGVSPERIVFANPCKSSRCLGVIRDARIPNTTFDSTSELTKIAQHCPQVGVILRIRADDPSARLPFGAKYGAMMDEVPELLSAATRMSLRVTGVSFHVGSGAGDPQAFRRAIAAARTVFDTASSLAMEPLHILDIGGGFSGGFHADGEPYLSVSGNTQVAQVINVALDDYFPVDEFPALRVISEPGRYFAEASSAMVTRVFGKRARWSGQPKEKPEVHDKVTAPVREWHYYITDGIYGNLNAIMYDAWLPRAVPFRLEEASSNHEMWTMQADNQPTDTVVRRYGECDEVVTIFGPTCDSLDMVFNRVRGVPELYVGDWLLFPFSGAYTAAGATDFNGIPATANAGVRTWYVKSESFEWTDQDKGLVAIYSETPPMEVTKMF